LEDICYHDQNWTCIINCQVLKHRFPVHLFCLKCSALELLTLDSSGLQTNPKLWKMSRKQIHNSERCPERSNLSMELAPDFWSELLMLSAGARCLDTKHFFFVPDAAGTVQIEPN
jgi:hypothetical protein